VVNCRFVKPLDPQLPEMALHTGKVLIVEENTLQGGFGGAVLESFADHGLTHVAIKRLGIPDVFIEHGPQDLLRERYEIDTNTILRAAKKLCDHDKNGPVKEKT
jgi:1-deoxy-D-xylulose-5-phosphate synthase